MKGRKPKPAAVRKLEGRRNQKSNKAAPQPQPSLLQCPEHITGEARAEWQRIAPELYVLGLLTKLDMVALELYCVMYAEHIEACGKVEELGLIIETKAGNVIQNPWLSIKHTSGTLMLKMATEFGMTPSSRSRLEVSAKPAEVDPMEELLDRIPRRGNTN